ncbi:hypothetical protein MNBD_IGNAVI01-39 [hydrothermal vent metagenome]|uniref:Secretion system C-terminal sorting domain-containing protein n=1 Tax=hydrothermal vent metagenome TaxID=652676 RepID=A0A3B1CNL8_9ZZZZ
MNNNIAKIYFITFISIFTLFQINGQSKKIESLTSFKSIFKQKIVRISDRFIEKFDTQKDFLQLFYYNVNKDIRWSSDQKPEKVIGMDGTQEALRLIDDGCHFDSNIDDGIYANYHFRNKNELLTHETIIDVCCSDSIGIIYTVSTPPVTIIPDVPQIIFPQHNEVIFSKRPTIRWSVGLNTNNCGIVLLDGSLEFGEIFQHLLWEKEIVSLDKKVFSEILPFKLSHGREYNLIIWSSSNNYLSSPEDSRGGGYSMEYITFRIDTTVVKTSFQVYQNYPNPFNNWTAITWYQNEKNIVSLNIYNILGEEVRFLLSNEFPAGENSVIWDGTDNTGYRISTGIYFLKIRLQNQIKTIKIVYKK